VIASCNAPDDKKLQGHLNEFPRNSTKLTVNVQKYKLYLNGRYPHFLPSEIEKQET